MTTISHLTSRYLLRSFVHVSSFFSSLAWSGVISAGLASCLPRLSSGLPNSLLHPSIELLTLHVVAKYLACLLYNLFWCRLRGSGGSFQSGSCFPKLIKHSCAGSVSGHLERPNAKSSCSFIHRALGDFVISQQTGCSRCLTVTAPQYTSWHLFKKICREALR